MASGVEMLGQMSETEALAGPVQGGNMVVKPNEVPVGGAAMLAKAMRRQGERGISGIYELPSQEPKTPEFMQMAQQNVERQAADQRNMYPNNFADDEGGILELPRNLRTAPGVPQTSLAYITDEEKAILGLLNPGTPHKGPEDVPSYDSMDYVASPSGSFGGATQSSYDTDSRNTGNNQGRPGGGSATAEVGKQYERDVADVGVEEAQERFMGRGREAQKDPSQFAPVDYFGGGGSEVGSEKGSDKGTISTISGVGDKINELDLTDSEKLLVTQAQNALAQGNQSKAQSIINSINNENLNAIFDSYTPEKGDSKEVKERKKSGWGGILNSIFSPGGFGLTGLVLGEAFGGPSKEDVLTALRAGETLTLDEQNVAAGLFLANQKNPDVLTKDQLEMLKSGSGFTSQDQLDKIIKSYREGEKNTGMEDLKNLFSKGRGIRSDDSISLEGLTKGLSRADKRMLKSTDPELYAKLNFANTAGDLEDLGKQQYIKNKFDAKGDKLSLTASEKAFNRKVMEARETTNRNKADHGQGGGRPRFMEEIEEEVIDTPTGVVDKEAQTMEYTGPRTGDVATNVPLNRRFQTDPTKDVAQYRTAPRSESDIYKYMTEGTTGEGIGLEPFNEYQKRRRKALGLEPLGLYG